MNKFYTLRIDEVPDPEFNRIRAVSLVCEGNDGAVLGMAQFVDKEKRMERHLLIAGLRNLADKIEAQR